MFKMIILLRPSLFAAAISANITAVFVNFGTDVFTHIDVWAPAVNTALLIFLYREGYRNRKKTDEVKAVAREGVEELKNVAIPTEDNGNDKP